jgi:hypothetical protein
MRKILTLLLLIVVSFTLMSCTDVSDLSAAETDLEVIDLQIIPELQHWLPQIAACAESIPEFGITTHILPDNALALNSTDLIIRLGTRRESDPYVSVLGTENLVILVGDEVQLSSITQSDLMDIYSGKMTHWDDETGSTIQTLSFPEGSTLGELFVETYLETLPINSKPTIFYTSEKLLSGLKANPYAIGYLLASQVPTGINILEVIDLDAGIQQQFVLAVTPEEPQGKLRNLLLCLQSP